MIYEIKRGAQVVWSGKAEGKQSRVIMQADMVEVTVKSPVAIAFQKGDTIKVYGETYKLNRPENIAKVHSQIGYTYTIEFEALYYDLGKWILYTLDGANKLTQPDVYLQGEARTILGLLVQNANRASSGWSLGIVDATDVIQWTYSSAKLLTVLQDIADQTNLEFWVDGKTINLTRRQNNTGLSLAYGKGRGLYELARARREDPIVTHLTVAGGSQNIPNGYGHRNIQPTGGNPMVNPSYQAGQDRVEGVIVFENIYPRLNAKVTATSAINVIRSTDIDFDLNAHLLDDGTSAQIAFTSGLLNGFTFTIAKDGYTHANRQILFNAIVDDNAYPQGIPNAQMKPAVGDTFVLLNINMPNSYKDQAEARVKELGDQYFAEEGIEQYDWTGKLTPKFVLENAVELTLGGLVTLQAEDIGFDGSIRVDSYTRDLQQEYLYDFTLSNVITINKMVRERNMSDRLANTVSKGISQEGLSSKATFAERAGFATTAGHANTATSAATALRADHATNADNAKKAEHANTADLAHNSTRWNGLLQTDYLTQPVRPSDNVSFAGIVATNFLRIPQVANAATDALWKSGSYAMLGSAKVWAGRADLWNGLAQPDYLDQAVRKADSPRFAGISSERFVSGFAGEGYRIAKDANGNIMAEFDRLTVRKDFTVYELIVNQIRATNGSLWVSDAIKIESVAKSGNNYVCKIDTDQGTIYVPFVVNDILRCQRFNGRSMKYYVARVTATNYTDGTFTVVIIEGASIPAASDEVVRMGNTTDKNRQGAIYLTASDNGAPYIDVIDGVTSASLAGKTRVRLGKLNGINDADFGQLSGDGLYANNVYLKGVLQIQAGSNVYTKIQADSNVSTAKSEAISSASSDATTKANNARTQAISAAATDAQSKANAARDAAINTANQFAQAAVDAIRLGARNYYRKDTPVEKSPAALIFERPRADAPNGFYAVGVNGNQAGSRFRLRGVITENGDWTVSGYARGSQSAGLSFEVDVCGLNASSVWIPADNQWRYFSVSVKVDNYSAENDFISIGKLGWAFYFFKDIKVEKGNKATDWSPAPEDLENALEVVRTETTTKFNVLETEINSKVAQSSFNALGQRVGSAESTITQQANQIAQRVTQTTFDALNNTVGGINGRVTTAESSIVQQAGQIAQRVTQTTFDALSDTVGGIGGRVSQAESTITQQANQIALRVTKTEVDTAISGVSVGGRNLLIFGANWSQGNVGSSWSGSNVYIANPNWIPTNEAKEITYTIYGEETIYTADIVEYRTNAATGESYIRRTNMPGSSSYLSRTHALHSQTKFLRFVFYRGDGVSPSYAKIGLKVKLELGNKASDWSPAPEDADAQFSGLSTRIVSAESSIVQQADQIALRATKTEVTTSFNGAINTASQDATNKSNAARSGAITAAQTYTDSQITIANNAISLKSDKTVTDALGTRLSSAEAKITPNEINLTVRGQTQDLVKAGTGGGTNLLIFSRNWGTSYLANNVTPGGGSYINNPNFISTDGESHVTYTLYGIETIYTADLIEYRSAEISNASYIRRTNVPGNSQFIKRTYELHPQTKFIRINYYSGNGVQPSWASIGKKVKLEFGNKSTDWSPAPEDVEFDLGRRPTTTEVQAGISITKNTVNVFGQAIKLTGMVTAESIDVNDLTVNYLRTSSAISRMTLNEKNDNALKVRHTNGQVGIEMGLIAGQPSMAFYDTNGNKLWEAGQGGIIYVNNVPESWARPRLILLHGISSQAQTLNLNPARNVLQQGAVVTPSKVVMSGPGSEVYLYYQGINVNADNNKVFAGYHSNEVKSTSNWIANGWYADANQFMRTTSTPDMYEMGAFKIWNGQLMSDPGTVTAINVYGGGGNQHT